MPARVGTTLGRYRLEALLGRGGFGTVYRATELARGGVWADAGGRGVALKVLHADVLADADGLERFRREAILAQRVEHPNVVRLYDFGEDEGVPYLVFELLVGRSLDTVVREEGALPPARVAHVTAQILKALMAVHSVGIVHRDVKPANVFLCDFSGDRDFAKLLDLGVAKSIRGRSLTDLTQAGQIIGTPQYMAPELIAGNASPAADLYALGLTMIRCLTGAPLFRGASAAEILQQQISRDAIPLPPAVASSWLAPVVRRAIEKDPSSRHADAASMLADLERARTNAAEPATRQMQRSDPRIDFALRPPTERAPAAVAPMPSTSYVVAPAPTIFVPPARPSIPSRRSRTPLFAALIGALAVAAAIVAVLVYVARSRTPDSPKPAPSTVVAKGTIDTIDDDEPPPPKKQKAPSDPRPLDAAKIRARIEADGWKVTPFISEKDDVTLSLERGNADAHVDVEIEDSTDAAKLIVEKLQAIPEGKGGVLARRGRVVVRIWGNMPNDEANRMANDLAAL